MALQKEVNRLFKGLTLWVLLISLPLTSNLPLPQPQLVVRSQSLLFGGQQSGRQIDLTSVLPSDEVFWLNFEEGYFACQLNASESFLKLYRLSRLCDGVTDCYDGSDELGDELGCSPECGGCKRGVCLDQGLFFEHFAKSTNTYK